MNETLYIIMRTDLDSMNQGKSIAQGSHATSAFHRQMLNLKKACLGGGTGDVATSRAMLDAYSRWETQTKQGFGTVLVLDGGDVEDIIDLVDDSVQLGYAAAVVHDPTYPIVDGNVVHRIPLDTCAYVFVPNRITDETARNLLGSYPLHF
jgi:peptidyl-tRNA hydrolase